jgi:hypothetical protein
MREDGSFLGEQLRSDLWGDSTLADDHQSEGGNI